jgi:hypothetical protein
MEDYVPNSLWTVWGLGHVLRPYKRPCILPTLYEPSFRVFWTCAWLSILVDIIYSDSPDEHRKHVRKILRRLRANNLYAKIEECALSVDTTDFLGFIIGPDDFRMDTSKIQVIRDWPTPRKGKDVQSFLGFANFYK